MIIGKYNPNNLDELIKIINKYTNCVESVSMQSGHFLVYYDNTEDRFIPVIAHELSSPRHQIIKEEIGYFPIISWEVGIKILKNINVKSKNILVLVNDWKYVNKGVDKWRFYKTYNKIPPYYIELINKSQDNINIIKPPSDCQNVYTGDFFSEQSLRNQFEIHVKNIFENADGKSIIELNKIFTEVYGDNIKPIENIFDYLFCKNKMCISEVAQLIFIISKYFKHNMFLNIVPILCRDYVIKGTELSWSLFESKIDYVINIILNFQYIKTERDITKDMEVIVHKKI